MPDDYADQVAEVAMELVSRVREDDPEANARWLKSVIDGEHDLVALAVVLAAAVPDDKPFSHSIAWTRMPARVLRPCGTVAAYRRHKARGEEPDQDCIEASRKYERIQKRLNRQQAVDAPGDES
jgi:hypothetical protein